MATSTALPGLSEDETHRLQFSAENGVVFDDAMRNCVVRLLDALQNPPPAPKAKAKKRTKKKAS